MMLIQHIGQRTIGRPYGLEVTDGQMETSTKSKSEIHRENIERELKLFKGFNILQIILSGFIG